MEGESHGILYIMFGNIYLFLIKFLIASISHLINLASNVAQESRATKKLSLSIIYLFLSINSYQFNAYGSDDRRATLVHLYIFIGIFIIIGIISAL